MRICTVIVDERPIRVLATDSFRKDSLVCFLHGWGDSADTFAPLLALAESSGYGAVTFDWPGFGSSPRPVDTWGASEYADFLGKFLDKYAKDSKEIILVAHSMGARFALRFTVEHPDRVSRIVLTGAAGIPPERDRRRDFAAKIAKKIFSLPILSLFYERVRDRFSSKDYRSSGAMRDIFLQIIALDQRDEYARLACPTLLLW
jgi:pimeloyl-ACP methyl ester carboxylesterase